MKKAKKVILRRAANKNRDEKAVQIAAALVATRAQHKLETIRELGSEIALVAYHITDELREASKLTEQELADAHSLSYGDKK